MDELRLERILEVFWSSCLLKAGRVWMDQSRSSAEHLQGRRVHSLTGILLPCLYIHAKIFFSVIYEHFTVIEAEASNF